MYDPLGPPLDVYPLRRGETLMSHEWVEEHVHRLLSSRFLTYAVAEGRRADIATSMILCAEAFRQDPAGTLPDDDVQLADLAKFGRDIDGWKAVRASVLVGWHRVAIEGDEEDAEPRLAHTMIASIAVRTYRRKASRDQGRKAQTVAVQHSRIRKKLMTMGFKHIARQKDAVTRIGTFLSDGQLWISEDNLRAALDSIGVVRVIPADFGGSDPR